MHMSTLNAPALKSPALQSPALAAGHAGIGAAGNALHGLVRRYLEHRRRQRDYLHLVDLPDYLLEDIGLTRAQIVKRRRFL